MASPQASLHADFAGRVPQPEPVDAFVNQLKLMASFGPKGILVVQSPNEFICDISEEKIA